MKEKQKDKTDRKKKLSEKQKLTLWNKFVTFRRKNSRKFEKVAAESSLKFLYEFLG